MRYTKATKGNGMDQNGNLKRDVITPDIVAQALRLIRNKQRLTQKEVSRRAGSFSRDRFGRLLESQISDFERGRTLPSFGSLLNLLAGLSESGTEVDFSVLQEAISEVISPGGKVDKRPAADRGRPVKSKVSTVPTSERLVDHTVSEISDLRMRMTNIERVVILNEVKKREALG